MIQESKARKETPLYSGVMKYFPDALCEVARLSKVGNDKHNPGEPLHWSREKSSDHGDCILRHQLDAGTYDSEDGFLHDVKVAWRALAQLQLALEKEEAEMEDLEDLEDLEDVTDGTTDDTTVDRHIRADELRESFVVDGYSETCRCGQCVKDRIKIAAVLDGVA